MHSTQTSPPVIPKHVIEHIRRRQSTRLMVRRMSLVLVGIACLILLFMAFNRSDNEQAHRVADEFILTIQSNNAGKAYDMGAPAFRTATTEEKLAQMFDQVEPFIAGAEIKEIDSYYAVSERGAPRAIIVTTATKGQKVTYIRLVMDKQPEGWKVHSILTGNDPLRAQPE